LFATRTARCREPIAIHFCPIETTAVEIILDFIPTFHPRSIFIVVSGSPLFLDLFKTLRKFAPELIFDLSFEVEGNSNCGDFGDQEEKHDCAICVEETWRLLESSAASHERNQANHSAEDNDSDCGMMGSLKAIEIFEIAEGVLRCDAGIDEDTCERKDGQIADE